MTTLRSVCLLACSLAAFAALASPAAGQSCAERIIDDWADEASPGIDDMYPVECYRQAIASLPEDLRSYSSAADDIRRALQERLRPQSDDETSAGGGSSGGGSGGGSGGDSSGGSGGSSPAAGGDKNGSAGQTMPEERAPAANAETTLPTTDGETAPAPESQGVAAPGSQLLGEEGQGSGSSIPAPVIAVIALVGAAALVGAVWLVWRQRHGPERQAG